MAIVAPCYVQESDEICLAPLSWWEGMNTRGNEREIDNLAWHFAGDSYYTSGVQGGAGRGRGGGGEGV